MFGFAAHSSLILLRFLSFEGQDGGLELEGRREEVEVGFGGTDAETAGVIQIEGADGGAAGGGEADEAGVLPGEVF